ncbi:ABC transporter permease [Neptunicoccus cionae]|uniref:ABC transporter permease n=1 Tax=Neptunicoccus cionae TaxID=2035344 RepID=A0A916QU72_9RHOB|nr:ABC transporter permease subunit [Amylibacter cionae]GGA11929.1 ABC transporter permease [Amylibacter cionae]
MFEFCVDPKAIEGLKWLSCYLTTPKHAAMYYSILTVLGLLAAAVPPILLLGFAGALARRSGFAPIRWIGLGYTSIVRGVPDIVFFLFFPIALDQAVEVIRHKIKCPDVVGSVYQGNDFVVCQAAKMPLGPSPQWVHEAWGFTLAVVTFAIVFGAFTANTLHGALAAVPRGQLETARAFGMTDRQTFWRVHLPQMWVYALPGLSNLWMILIKATPLLFLLGIKDIVYWAKELGGMKTQAYTYSHPDWRVWYFAALLVFYLLLTWVSQRVFDRVFARASRGMSVAR